MKAKEIKEEWAAGPPEEGLRSDYVLVAEDDPMYRHILKSCLERWGYLVSLARDGEEAWSLLQLEPRPNLLVFDWLMPGMEGPELCAKVRGQHGSRYAYILLITSKGEKEDMIRGLEAGADDYITKPFTVAELRARIGVGRRILTLQDELIRAREELRFGATHDWLTGLWNRGTGFNLMDRELQRAKRSHAQIGLLMIDIDRFKKINDSYGHLAGDMVLRELAKRLQEAVRSYDIVSRFGGEEFTVLVSEAGQEDVIQWSERLRSSVANTPFQAGEMEIAVTISIGAVLSNGATASAEALLRSADAALYLAKQSGRNCVKGEWDMIPPAAPGITTQTETPHEP